MTDSTVRRNCQDVRSAVMGLFLCGCLGASVHGHADATSSTGSSGPPSSEPVGVSLTLAPNPLDFGYVLAGQTAVACSTLGDAPSVDLTVSAVTDFETVDGAFALLTPLPLTIAAGESAQICFSLTPTNCDGQVHGPGHVALVTNPPVGSNPVVQLGDFWCGGGPQITCTPLTIDFGPTKQQTTVTMPVICTNSGTPVPGGSLTIQQPSATPSVFSAGFDQTRNPYPPAGLEPGQMLRIDVSYTPVASSSDPGMLSVASNGGATVRIPLLGRGTP